MVYPPATAGGTDPIQVRAAMLRISSIAITFVVTIAIALPGVGITAQRHESFEGFMRGIRTNAVKGEAFYHRTGASFGFEPGLKLEEGDSIKTSSDGYAELLLQPGNYLRAGSDTDVQIVSDQYDKMKLKLNHGAISVEILSREDMPGFYNSYEAHELIRIITPGAEVFISQPGIFRINAATGRTELIVRNGEAVINGERVKKKRRAVNSKNNLTITEIDSKNEDAFDLWARERADTLVKANKSLKHESPWADKKKEGMERTVDVPDEESQGSSPFVVSARPGTVNFVEAGVEFSQDASNWKQLTEESELKSGDKLRTGANSFAELMLFPDMYFRVNGSSEVVFTQLSNDLISLQVLRGSVILDAARFNRKLAPPITIAATSTAAAIAEAGNYRVDASVDQITVRDGKLLWNERSVGACHKIATGVVSDCDKKRTDNFDRWSEHRGEGELFTGRSVIAMATFLARLRRQRFRNTGFWFQHTGQTSYTFVPFTSELFRSPYGGNYSTVLAPRRPLHRVDMGGRSMRFPRPQIARPIP